MSQPQVEFDAEDIVIACGVHFDMVATMLEYQPVDVASFVLEAGCGTGKFSMNIASRTHANVVMLDSDEKALDRAQRYLMAVEGLRKGSRLPVIVRQGDILHMPFHEDVFDLVFNEGVIEHFIDPLPAIREMMRVSRGAVIAIVPSALNLKQKLLAKSQTEAYAGQQHWAAYEKPMLPEEAVGYFKTAGLGDVRHAFLFTEHKVEDSRPSDYRMIMVGGRKPS